jgi:glycerol-3-phosphate cytidylyltransferase
MLNSRFNKVVGFAAGCFDVGPHAGHFLMLEEAKNNCEYLIVGLHVDPTTDRPDSKRKPLPSLSERYIALAACKFVDEIIPYQSEEELLNLLKALKPNIRFIGGDYKNMRFTGDDIAGLKNHFCSRDHDMSSTALRKKIIVAGIK